jgi:hypothetical protein
VGSQRGIMEDGLMVDGDQNIFPVYEPDADALRKKWREAEEEARAHHYDSTKEGECVPRT